MYIEIGVPAVLPLGMVKLAQDGATKICQLGLAVQHPPVNLFVQKDNRQFSVTGGRADLGHLNAKRFFAAHDKKPLGIVEIENTIPTLVGMGSDVLNGMALMQGLSWAHELPHERGDAATFASLLNLDARHGLEYAAFAQGGLLLVDTEAAAGEMPAVAQRVTIAYEKEKTAWAFVLFFPRVPQGISPNFEAEQYAAALRAAAHLSEKSGELVTGGMKTAVQVGDIVAFAQSLMLLQQMNDQALAKSGRVLELSDEDRAVMEVMQAHGAVAWGRSMTGMAIWGLVKGGQPSRVIRKKVLDQVGYFGGIVMATVAENEGARYKINKDEDLIENKFKPVRLKPEVAKRRDG